MSIVPRLVRPANMLWSMAVKFADLTLLNKDMQDEGAL